MPDLAGAAAALGAATGYGFALLRRACRAPACLTGPARAGGACCNIDHRENMIERPR
jgi:hypothetical protein